MSNENYDQGSKPPSPGTGRGSDGNQSASPENSSQAGGEQPEADRQPGMGADLQRNRQGLEHDFVEPDEVLDAEPVTRAEFRQAIAS